MEENSLNPFLPEAIKSERRQRRVRRLFQSFLILTIFTYLVSVSLGYLTNGTVNLWGSSTIRLIVGLGLVSFFLSHNFIPRRILPHTIQIILACFVVIGGMWWVSYTFTGQVEELGRVSTMITAFIGFMILTQALPDRYVPPSLAILAIGTLGLIFADLYWPTLRPILPDSPRIASYGIVFVAAVFMVVIVLRDFADYSLRAKLIGITLFLTLLIVGATTYAVGAAIRQAVAGQAEERLHVLTKAQAVALGELLARQISTLQATSFNFTIQTAVEEQNQTYSGSQAEIIDELLAIDFRWLRARDNDPLIERYQVGPIAEELQEYRQAFPENVEVFVTDQYGALVAATNRTSDFYQADETWWQRAYNDGRGAVYASTPTFETSSNTLALVIAVPIFNHIKPGEQAEVIGVLRTTYSVDGLISFLGGIDIGDEGVLDLYFADGTSLRVVEGVAEFRIAPLSPATMTSLLPTNDTVTNFNYDGISSLITRYPVSTLSGDAFIADLGWYMVSAQSEAAAFAPVAAQQRTNILLGVVAVMIGGVAAAIVSQIISTPIARLTEAAARVSQGDLQTRVLVQGRDEISVLSMAFNNMTDQLLDAINNLEQRVTDRTRALNISTEVGRRLATILDRQQLVTETVEQIQAGFNYYHTHMYLLDETGEHLLMVGGTGKAGQQMLAQGHKIRVGQGLVGRAAATNLPLIVPDVSQEPGWLPNPLLPDTQAEIAIPIAIGTKPIGVLDVQHNIVNGLQQQDADLLLSIANLVAIALQNARLLEEAQEKANQAEQITQIKEKIQSTTTVEGALQVAIRELGRLTGLPSPAIRLQSNGHTQDTPSH
ncbi:MAG: GAF domain-containing protein [Anaerolineae bacterium]|nr:GAF domain-containing protein [Anaerolineae bacterium]